MKDYNYRKRRIVTNNKVCNVKGCPNTFDSPVWYVCEEHRDLDKEDYDYKIDDPEKYYKDLKK